MADSDTITNSETFEKLIATQRIMEMLHRKHMMERGPAGDPTRGRGRIIALLKLRDGVPTRDIAQILGIRVSSLNEVLAKLERDGLVERVQSEADGRVMLVYLTDKGREESQDDGLHDKVFAGFGDEELEMFDAGLTKIIANLEAELGEDAQTLLEEGRARREEFFEHHGGQGRGHGPDGHRGHGHGHGGHGHGGPGGRERGGRGRGRGGRDELFGDHGPHLC
ncbi:MAG: MarR family winged helix-turn-helix transcriptional regulator [Coriobacteriales bacterium]|jgi:DNA-binding MarR family transcriptional regulator